MSITLTEARKKLSQLIPNFPSKDEASDTTQAIFGQIKKHMYAFLLMNWISSRMVGLSTISATMAHTCSSVVIMLFCLSRGNSPGTATLWPSCLP